MKSSYCNPVALTANHLRHVLSFDHATGQFSWNKKRGCRAAGSPAGCVDWTNRRVLIGIDGKLYLAHRLAWLHFYGEWPTNDVDHRDGDSLNNSIANLRDASPSQNIANSRLSKANTTGFKGVAWDKGRGQFVAKIKKNYKARHLGRFSTAEKAHAAYAAAAKDLFG